MSTARCRGRPRDRLSAGSVPFDGSGSCGIASAATPRPRRPGFPDPHDAFVSASNLPGVFHPGPSLGFSPSGLLPRFGSRASLDASRPSCRFPCAVTSTAHAAASGRISGGGRHPARTVTSAPGRCPRGVFASPGFSTDRSLRLPGRTPSQTFRSGFDPARGLSGKPNRPAFPGLDGGGRSRPS